MRPQLLSLLLLSALPAVSGCAILEDVVNGVQLPSGDMNRVDLVRAPSTNQMLSWSCVELLGSALCSTVGLGTAPSTQDLLFSFDLVFDLSNPNDAIPIPLVELLLGMSVFEGANLGVACISFCDPQDEACLPALDAQNACQADDSQEGAPSAGDLIPTVDELVNLANNVVNGEDLGYGNGDFRYIEPLGTMEAHIQFDLAPDIVLGLADELLGQAVDDVIGGQNVKLNIPYAVEGSMFFDVPENGRYALGFGPFADQWDLAVQ